MTSITIRDLSMTETLDRQASLRVKGGSWGWDLKPIHPPTDLNLKIAPQVQVGVINNIAVGIGGPFNFQQIANLGQGQDV